MKLKKQHEIFSHIQEVYEKWLNPFVSNCSCDVHGKAASKTFLLFPKHQDLSTKKWHRLMIWLTRDSVTRALRKRWCRFSHEASPFRERCQSNRISQIVRVCRPGKAKNIRKCPQMCIACMSGITLIYFSLFFIRPFLSCFQVMTSSWLKQNIQNFICD